MSVKNKTEWYADGLHFHCTQCGNCCTGPSGYVWFNYEELVKMAEYVKLEPAVFLLKYARQVDGKWTLAERRRGTLYDCVFLAEDPKSGKRGCSIYPVRPQQCRTWPFWPENLKSERAWKATARRVPCPGMQQGGRNEVGQHYTLQQIRIQRDASNTE